MQFEEGSAIHLAIYFTGVVFALEERESYWAKRHTSQEHVLNWVWLICLAHI